ncbi:UNVERIFIED_CONTAM: hypothetical protein FKN15_011682 [Acipenser sinensis]
MFLFLNPDSVCIVGMVEGLQMKVGCWVERSLHKFGVCNCEVLLYRGDSLYVYISYGEDSKTRGCTAWA